MTVASMLEDGDVFEAFNVDRGTVEGDPVVDDGGDVSVPMEDGSTIVLDQSTFVQVIEP